MRVLFWVQQLLGSGHLKRAATLASAMAERGLEVTLATGGMPASWLVPAPAAGRVEVVQLPPIRASDPSFAQLVDAVGRPEARAAVDDAVPDGCDGRRVDLFQRRDGRHGLVLGDEVQLETRRAGVDG